MAETVASAFTQRYGDVAAAPQNARRGGRYPSKPLTGWDAVEVANLSMIPGVSDVASLAMAGKEAQAGNWGAAGLNALGVLPFIPAFAGIFAGKGAKTADVVKLAQAQEMTKADAKPFDVWQQTGWTDQFPDGKWRFEIDDSGAKFNLSGRGEEPLTHGHGTFDYGPTFGKGNLLEHPELERAYDPAQISPHTQVRDSMTLLNTDRAAFDPTTKTTTLYAPAPAQQAKGSTLHELQHAIQGREGFARGGSSSAMRISDMAPPELVNSVKNSHTYRMMVAGGRRPDDALEGLLAPYMDPGGMGSAAAAREDAYRRLAGEAEARLVQQRMNYTPAMRRAVAPWQQFDVPVEQQILRGLSRFEK